MKKGNQFNVVLGRKRTFLEVAVLNENTLEISIDQTLRKEERRVETLFLHAAGKFTLHEYESFHGGGEFIVRVNIEDMEGFRKKFEVKTKPRAAAAGAPITTPTPEAEPTVNAEDSAALAELRRRAKEIYPHMPDKKETP